MGNSMGKWRADVGSQGSKKKKIDINKKISRNSIYVKNIVKCSLIIKKQLVLYNKSELNFAKWEIQTLQACFSFHF